MNKTQILILVSGLIYSSLGFSYGVTFATLESRQYVCDVKTEKGLSTRFALVRTLKEKRNHKVPVSRQLNTVFYELADIPLAQQIVAEFNEAQPSRIDSGRSLAQIIAGETLNIGMSQVALPLETRMPEVKSEVFEIDSNSSLALSYTRNNFSYSDAIPLSVEINMSAVDAKTFTIDADLYYTIYSIGLDVQKPVLTKKEIGLAGTCTQSN